MSNWKIGKRIVTGFGVVLLITTLLGAFAYNRANATEQSESMLADNALPSIAALGRQETRVQSCRDLLAKHLKSADTVDEQTTEQQIQELRAANAKDLKSYEDTPSDAQETALYEKVKAAQAAYWNLFDQALHLSQTNTPLNKTKAGLIADIQLRSAGHEYFSTLQKLVDNDTGNAYGGLHDIQKAVASSKTGALVGIAIALACAIPVVFFIARSITAPLGMAVKVLEEVGRCNLAVSLDVTSKDEIGQMARSLNSALSQLRSTLSAVTDSAQSATASSQELASAAESIASGSQEQAASLEETSSSLEQITATVRQSADNAREANQLALSSRDSAEKGRQVVDSAVAAMTEINTASSRIADIISTVEEIAFQTNLLAVNAAVEAARAGDEGRGFAVVATEVRSLAQRSSVAAKEIKALIQDSLHKVERGSELVNRSGETLQGILTSVKRVTDIVGEISAAANEQSTGIDQVNTAVTQIDQVTQANSSQTEELSSTAQSLSQQSSRLLRLVGVFRLDTDETGSESPEKFEVAASAPAVTKVATPKRKAAPVRNRYKPQGSGMLGVAPAVLATAGGGSDSFEEF